MRVTTRCLLILIGLTVSVSCVVAKDVDSKRAKRSLDSVFSKSPGKARDKEIAKLEGDTLDEVAGIEARAHALTLQTTPPKKLPKLEEAFEGALNYEYEVRSKRANYKTFALLDLPPGYAKDKPAPLLIGLHSALGTAWRELVALRASGSAIADHPMRDCIVACPNAINRGSTSEDPRENPPGIHEYFGWGPKREGIDSVFNLLDKLIAEYNIDRERIYLEGGPGMGSEAVFHLTMLRPSQFAAICVRDSLPPLYYTELEPKADLEELRKAGTLGEQKVVFPWVECYHNTPIYWVQGDDDRKYPTAHARQARDAMKASGATVEYTEYEGGHASGPTGLVTKALRSCLGCKRTTLPVAVNARGVRDDSASLGNDRNYWVEITSQSFEGKKGEWAYKILAGGTVTVTANKAENTLTIVSDGVREIRVYLTDELLYLDKEIKLIVNGKERSLAVTRDLQVLAETANVFASTGEAFTAALNITTG